MQFAPAGQFMAPRAVGARQQPIAARQPTRSDMYLPAMPDMLHGPAQTSMPARYAQKGTVGSKPASVIRGQAPEENPIKSVKPQSSQELVKLTIPPPEDLGLGHAGAAETGQSSGAKTDWANARSRLDQLGAAFYRLEKISDGKFHFVCAVSSSKSPTQQHQFEATATTEGEAIQQALAQVEQWVQPR
jgi:hypothetical protein